MFGAAAPTSGEGVSVPSEDRRTQVQAIEGLAADERLVRLIELVKKRDLQFDALDFVGHMRLGSGAALWGWEEFHSGVLAWLLDPLESHGAGNFFLTRLLRIAHVQSDTLPSDWSRATVHREWANDVDGQRGYLDILVVNEAERVLCAIENKVFSSEHSMQLTRYQHALERGYPDFTRLYVFLTPEGTLPLHKEDQAHWKPVAYDRILTTVQEIVDDNWAPVGDDLRAFLRQYATTLRRNIVPETSVSQLARRLYIEHRMAIECINAYKPDFIAEMKLAFKEAISRVDGWQLDCESNRFLRFRSTDWESSPSYRTGTGWLQEGSNALLLFQINFRDGVSNLPYLDLALSPGVDEAIRQSLFARAKQKAGVFGTREPGYHSGWLILCASEYILEESDFDRWDDPAVWLKVEARMADFAERWFPAMNQVLLECFHSYDGAKRNPDSR